MTVTELMNDQHTQEATQVIKEEQLVNVSYLAELTGFPIDFIKHELLLAGDQLSLKELRAAMLRYLDVTFQK